METMAQPPTGSRRAKEVELTNAGMKRRSQVMDAFHAKHLRKDGKVVTDYDEARKLAVSAAEAVSTNPITMHSQF